MYIVTLQIIYISAVRGCRFYVYINTFEKYFICHLHMYVKLNAR